MWSRLKPETFIPSPEPRSKNCNAFTVHNLRQITSLVCTFGSFVLLVHFWVFVKRFRVKSYLLAFLLSLLFHFHSYQQTGIRTNTNIDMFHLDRVWKITGWVPVGVPCVHCWDTTFILRPNVLLYFLSGDHNLGMLLGTSLPLYTESWLCC